MSIDVEHVLYARYLYVCEVAARCGSVPPARFRDAYVGAEDRGVGGDFGGDSSGCERGCKSTLGLDVGCVPERVQSSSSSGWLGELFQTVVRGDGSGPLGSVEVGCKGDDSRESGGSSSFDRCSGCEAVEGASVSCVGKPLSVGGGDGSGLGTEFAGGRGVVEEENGEVVDEVLNGGERFSGVVAEEKRIANRLKRQKAKERKLRKQQRQGSDVDDVPEWRRGAVKIGQYVAGVVSAGDVDGDLKDSVKRKWIAKNKLQALEAERRAAVLEANSLEDEVKQYRTNVRAVTERNMVSIEKTHAQLSVSDNVPMEDRVLSTDAGSRVQTVNSGASSQTISPDSSASQAEYRAAQKKILDQEAEIERLKLGLKKLGVSWEVAEFVDKQTWTLENGELPERSREILDMLYPSGYGERGQPWCEGVPEKTWIIPG